jgi:hypothetical protein
MKWRGAHTLQESITSADSANDVVENRATCIDSAVD